MTRLLNINGEWYNVIEYDATWELCRYVLHKDTGKLTKYLSINYNKRSDCHLVATADDYNKFTDFLLQEYIKIMTNL